MYTILIVGVLLGTSNTVVFRNSTPFTDEAACSKYVEQNKDVLEAVIWFTVPDDSQVEITINCEKKDTI